MFFPRCHHKLLPSFLPSRLGSNVTYHIRHFYSFSFDWRTVALQCYNGFCHTSTWIGHRYTYAPSLLNSSPTSLPIPLQTLFLIGLYLNRIFLVAQMVKNLPSMQKTWVWSLGRKDLLEKEMAIHSSILAWRIPWTQEPGKPWGHKRVRHNWATKLLLNYIYVKVKVIQSCPTLYDPMDCIAFPFSRESSQSRDRTQVFRCI